MTKSCFLGLKRVKKVVLGPEKDFGQIGKKWPKYGKKLFSRPKEGQNVQKVILSKKFFFGQIGEKIFTVQTCTHTNTHTGFYLKF